VFTGIVEELGDVVRLEVDADCARLSVRGPVVAADAVRGASIAVNGACLTVTDLGPDATFTADVMPETLHRTTLGDLAPGDAVNLERPLPAGGRLGGHLVQGHVDGVGTVLERRSGGKGGDAWDLVRIGVPPPLARYVAEKGSIAVDGVSLTVVDVVDGTPVDAGSADTWFSVALIPQTLGITTLGRRRPGERVNLEVDVLAKYTERLLGGARTADGGAAGVAGEARA
jgi:riboflavin synthase